MKQVHRLTGLIEKEGNGYVSSCPELDIAGQGDTIEQARRNLTEAIELFLEAADPSEVQRRMVTELYVTPIEVAIVVDHPAVRSAAFSVRDSMSEECRS